MRRRQFMTLIGGAAALPLAARAQQTAKIPTIGFMGVSTPTAWSHYVAAFERRLAELNWIKGRTVALYACADALISANAARINALALAARLPTMFYAREYIQGGGLMSYGPNVSDLFRRSADFVDKILRGAKPSDIPVEQPTTLELIINLKTARALGLALSSTLLATADEVIE
jgi:ABC-type uncharacterized transport system substrate-binding protein